MATEASYILSGFGKYTHEILKRLHKTNKYVIGEFASYGVVNDPRDKSINWTYYANSVNQNDARHAAYNSDPHNQFGKWRFDKVLLDFKPDIVFDVRDTQMFEYQKNSAFRRLFHWAIMPTVDSLPQQESWIHTYTQADGVFTYSDWGLNVLKDEGGGLIKLHQSAPPGVDTEVLKPVADRRQHKKNMGFYEDIFIIGTVMRNQKRKLFPELIEAFKKYLDFCYNNGQKKLADKSFLYLHTSYPDNGWDIPRLVKESGIGHKIIFTYCCKRCKSNFASFFQDAKTVCATCKSSTAVLPSVGTGLDADELSEVLNLFDVYVQYANCEGFGVPMVEAAACGVPVMATDYSAMTDVVRKLNGYPLQIQKKYREIETGAYRAYPDNDFFAQQLFKFFTQPEALRKRKEHQARKGVEQHYTWDKTAKIWEDYFDSVQLTGDQGNWEAPDRLFLPAQQMPDNLSNGEVVDWALENILGVPEQVNSYEAMKLLRNLNYGVWIEYGRGVDQFSREDLVNMMLKQTQTRNTYEQLRCGMLPIPTEDFIEYAHLKNDKNKEKTPIYRTI